MIRMQSVIYDESFSLISNKEYDLYCFILHSHCFWNWTHYIETNIRNEFRKQFLSSSNMLNVISFLWWTNLTIIYFFAKQYDVLGIILEIHVVLFILYRKILYCWQHTRGFYSIDVKYRPKFAMEPQVLTTQNIQVDI